MKRSKYTIWELLVFIFGCTVCTVLLAISFAIIISGEPTTAANLQVRVELLNFLKYITCTIMGIVSAIVVVNQNERKDKK